MIRQYYIPCLPSLTILHLTPTEPSKITNTTISTNTFFFLLLLYILHTTTTNNNTYVLLLLLLLLFCVLCCLSYTHRQNTTPYPHTLPHTPTTASIFLDEKGSPSCAHRGKTFACRTCSAFLSMARQKTQRASFTQRVRPRWLRTL